MCLDTADDSIETHNWFPQSQEKGDLWELLHFVLTGGECDPHICIVSCFQVVPVSWVQYLLCIIGVNNYLKRVLCSFIMNGIDICQAPVNIDYVLC